MRNAMHYKIAVLWLFLTAFIGFSGCTAATGVEQNVQTQKTKNTQTIGNQEVVESENVEIKKTINDSSSGVSSTNIENFPVKLWQVIPNRPVYNAQGNKVDSLRLRASVMVQSIENEKAIIDNERGYWVNLSDLTNKDPKILLERPQHSNGLPHVRIDEALRDRSQGDGN